MDEQRTTFGELLRRLRLRAGLSQVELAERANVSVAAVTTLERGVRRTPYPRTVEALADALGISSATRAGLRMAAEVSRARPTPSAPDPAVMQAMRLPLWLTSFVGREAEVEALRALLDPSAASAVRLLTLIGPGGVGKTRLAVAVAATLADRFTDSVVLVDLAPLHDARLVPATIAHALEVPQSGGRSAHDLVLEYLRQRQVLLVLDNFEHLLAAAALVSEVLRWCALVSVLVTSRTVLRLQGERLYPVVPLATPAVLDHNTAIEDIHSCPSVQLFVERAQAVAPGFELTSVNVDDVARICRRLDGMPLAIELAAARASLLGPNAILHRLERRLPLLVGGPTDAPERQRTLRETLMWSHDLLGSPERVLFRRLSVFAGGWTLEGAEAVCTDTQLPVAAVFDRLQGLVDSSLVQAIHSGDLEQRFGMLETIREYALGQLEEAGENGDLRVRHAEYFLRMSERAEAHLTRAEQADWVERLDRELDNLRTVLEWARNSEQPELGLQLAVSLCRFWEVSDRGHEGRAWLESLLRRLTDPGEPPHIATLHAQALGTTAWITYLKGDHQSAGELAEQCLSRWRQLGQVGNTTVALNTSAFVAGYMGDVPRQEAMFQQSLDLSRASGDEVGAAWVATWLATVRLSSDDLDGAETLLTEALAVFQERGDTNGIALATQHLGNVAAARRDFRRAETILERSLSLYGALHSEGAGVAYVLGSLAGLAACRGELEQARTLCDKGVSIFRRIGSLRGLAAEIGFVGRVAALQGDDASAVVSFGECLELNRALVKVDLVFVLEWLAEVRARTAIHDASHDQLLAVTRLLGAAAALRSRLGAAATRSWAIPLTPSNRAEHEHQIAQVRAMLGASGFQEAWAAGWGLPVQRAITEALTVTPLHALGC